MGLLTTPAEAGSRCSDLSGASFLLGLADHGHGHLGRSERGRWLQTKNKGDVACWLLGENGDKMGI